jgi:hypothetical protein
MLRLKIISFLLLIVFSIQAIPVVKPGDLLGGINKEMAQDMTDDTNCSQIEDFSTTTFLPSNTYSVVSNATGAKDTNYSRASQNIPAHHSPDVVTPPPDFIA